MGGGNGEGEWGMGGENRMSWGVEMGGDGGREWCELGGGKGGVGERGKGGWGERMA